MRHRRAAHIATITLSAIALAGTTLAAPAANAVPSGDAVPSEDAVIAEVYGGGGNSGATLTHDFIELGNRAATAVSLAGWSVQYLSASPSSSSRWQVTPLTGSIQLEKRYLIAEARGAGGTTALPTPDATGTISMAASQGTVALVRATEALTCLTAAECAADSRIHDLVGYGSAVVRETAPAPAASNTTSVARSESLTDTDDNSANFTSGTPTPTNSAGAGDPGPDPEPVSAKISAIQGTKRLSPLEGQEVITQGIVTARRAFGARGFWIEDPAPDNDPRTSEGLFVFTGSTTPAVAPGDAVTVTGTVKEFYPTNPATSPHQSTTELINPQWTVTSQGNPIPPAELLKPDTVPGTLTAKPGGNIESLELQPDTYALDFWESREGMRVELQDAQVVGPTTSFNELYVTTDPAQYPSARGGTVYSGYGNDPTGVLKVESLIAFSERPFPKVNTGDKLVGRTSGPIEYDQFGGYTLMASELGKEQSGGIQREETRAQAEDELAIASYNVENLSGVDAQDKFDALANGIVVNLASPDIVVLEEVQDNTGPNQLPDDVVAADQTLDRFTAAITKAGGPSYQWRQIDPQQDADGGQPRGNIRVAFLFNPARVSFVDRPGGDATTPVEVVDKKKSKKKGKPALSISPGRIDPANPAFEDSRKPLAGEFVFEDHTVFVVANHFNSKGGDQPVHGRFQPPNRSSEVQRVQQAQAVRAFVDDVLEVEESANVVVAGDINDYQFSPTIGTLTDGGALRALVDTLPQPERYGYVFEGKSQVLDHILISRAMRLVDFDVVHINAEFHQQTSDHDPAVARIKPAAGKSSIRPK